MPTVFPRASRSVLSARPDNRNGLIAWYTFEGLNTTGIGSSQGGRNIIDRSGNSNYATGGNGTQSVPSPFGSAAYMRNTNGGYFISVAANSSIYTAGLPLTIAFWMMPSFQGSHGVLGVLGGGVQAGLTLNTAGQVIYGGTSGTTIGAPNGSYVSGSWVHVALELTAASATIFINGKQSATSASVVTVGALSLLQFGTRGGIRYDGQFADFRVYNRLLAPVEVSQIYGSAKIAGLGPEMMAFTNGTIPNNVSVIGAGSALSAQKTAETIFVFI